MTDTLLFFAVVALAGLIFLPLHVVAIRALGGAKLITALNISIVLSAGAGGAAGWWLFGSEFTCRGAGILALVAGGLTFAGFAGIYGLVGPVSVDRSVSSHIVSLIYLAPSHRISETQLFGLYTHDDVLRKRFNECVATGIVARHGNELTVTSRGARIARAYLVLGRLLGIPMWHLERHSGAPRQG